MNSLCHLIYTSAAAQQMTEEELFSLLQAARASNKDRGVTGILLYIEGTFFQVIEGEPATVKELYGRIRNDPRHIHVTTIIEEPIARRAFAEWTMGYDFVSQGDLDLILDVYGVRGNRHSVSRLKESRARKLLTAFSEGRWRSRLVQPEGSRFQSSLFDDEDDEVAAHILQMVAGWVTIPPLITNCNPTRTRPRSGQSRPDTAVKSGALSKSGASTQAHQEADVRPRRLDLLRLRVPRHA